MGHLNLRITAKTGLAWFVMRLITPLLFVGLISEETAVRIVWRFVQVAIRPEGWGGD